MLVLGADEGLVRRALAKLGQEDGVIVLDPSAEALERLERAVRDPRVWYQVGDAQVVPLPDHTVDEAFGPSSEDVRRVLR